MKKIKFIILLFFIVLITACAASSNIFDDSIPLESSATIVISEELVIKSYNGIPVSLKKPSFGSGGTGFTFPAGRATFIMDLDTGMQMSNVRYMSRDISLTYNFEAGKEYQLRFWFADDEGNIDRSNWGRGWPAVLLSEGDFTRYVHKVPLTFN